MLLAGGGPALETAVPTPVTVDMSQFTGSPTAGPSATPAVALSSMSPWWWLLGAILVVAVIYGVYVTFFKKGKKV